MGEVGHSAEEVSFVLFCFKPSAPRCCVCCGQSAVVEILRSSMILKVCGCDARWVCLSCVCCLLLPLTFVPCCSELFRGRLFYGFGRCRR